MPDRPRNAVLITRPEPGATATAAAVAALGFEPVIAPLLAVEALAVDLPAPAGLRAVLATSRNAIQALPPAWHALPLLAVGDATARRASEAGFSDVKSAAGDARALAELAARLHAPSGPPLLLVSGAGQGEALDTDLRQRGFSVLRREVYAARPVRTLPEHARTALHRGDLLATLFFSAETARAFVALVSEAALSSHLAGVDALAIGRSVAVALESLPWRSIRVAARPNLDEILALLR